MFVIFGQFGVLCFLVTSVMRFAFLPYYRRSHVKVNSIELTKLEPQGKPQLNISGRIFRQDYVFLSDVT